MSQTRTLGYDVAVTDEDAEQLLHDLVATPSLSGDETQAVRLLVEWMAAHGYDRAFIDDAGNAVGIIGSGECEIVLLGHIDTVDGFPPVRRDARRLYGRGTVDAKGPLCAFAVAAARAALPDNIRLIVIGAVEEEGSSRGARYAATQYRPHACIIGEPSNWDRITLGYKGRLLLEWRWDGALAHSAGQAATAAEHAFSYWRRVQDYVEAFNRGRSRIFERLDTTLQAINSGEDGAFGWARMTVGFRLPPGVAPEEIAADLAVNEDGAAVRAYGMETAFVAEKDNALSRALRGAIRAEGAAPRFVHKTGTADMNIVGPLWNCPILAYGPGDSALDHTPDEYIDLDEYLRAIRVLASAVERLGTLEAVGR